jgi:hypothetical protein
VGLSFKNCRPSFCWDGGGKNRLRRTWMENGINQSQCWSDDVIANFWILIQKYFERLGAQASVRRLARRPALWCVQYTTVQLMEKKAFGQGPLNDGQILRTTDRLSDCTDYLYNGQTILRSKDNWIMKKRMYDYQLFKWCSWSILIIIHVLNTQFGGCCNGRHCFAVSCFYLINRPSFATGEELSQSDQSSTCMGTSSVSNGVAGLYWS